MNNAIGGANLTFTVPLSGNSAPTQSFSPLSSGGGDFMSQLAAAITNALFGGQQGAQGAQGNQGNQSNFGGGQGGGFGGGSPVGGQQGGGSSLQQLLAEVMQDLGITPQNSPFNVQSGQTGQANAGAFSQGMQNGLSNPSQGGSMGPTGGPGGFGGPGLAMPPQQQSQFSPASMQGPGNFQQLGNQMGSAMSNKAGLQQVDDMTAKSGPFPGMNKIEGGSKETAQEMGKFMDQYPDIFGKPDAGKLPGLVGGNKHNSSWEDALSNGGMLSDDSVKKFEQAKGMMKSVMEGDMGNPNLQLRGIGGSSVGMDAAMTAGNINKAAMNQLV